MDITKYKNTNTIDNNTKMTWYSRKNQDFFYNRDRLLQIIHFGEIEMSTGSFFNSIAARRLKSNAWHHVYHKKLILRRKFTKYSNILIIYDYLDLMKAIYLLECDKDKELLVLGSKPSISSVFTSKLYYLTFSWVVLGIKVFIHKLVFIYKIYKNILLNLWL